LSVAWLSVWHYCTVLTPWAGSHDYLHVFIHRSRYLFVVDEPTQLLVPLRVSGQHKIWKLQSKTAAMARAGLGSQRSLTKPKPKKDVTQAELDESDDLQTAVTASLGGTTSWRRRRLPGDVGVSADLSVVDLRPSHPPPCAVSVLPHSNDYSQLTVEILQEGKYCDTQHI
jgi:hypothetical protein